MKGGNVIKNDLLHRLSTFGKRVSNVLIFICFLVTGASVLLIKQSSNSVYKNDSKKYYQLVTKKFYDMNNFINLYDDIFCGLELKKAGLATTPDQLKNKHIELQEKGIINETLIGDSSDYNLFLRLQCAQDQMNQLARNNNLYRNICSKLPLENRVVESVTGKYHILKLPDARSDSKKMIETNLNKQLSQLNRAYLHEECRSGAIIQQNKEDKNYGGKQLFEWCKQFIHEDKKYIFILENGQLNSIDSRGRPTPIDCSDAPKVNGRVVFLCQYNDIGDYADALFYNELRGDEEEVYLHKIHPATPINANNIAKTYHRKSRDGKLYAIEISEKLNRGELTLDQVEIISSWECKCITKDVSKFQSYHGTDIPAILEINQIDFQKSNKPTEEMFIRWIENSIEYHWRNHDAS